MTAVLKAQTGHRYASLFSSAPWTEAVARTYGFCPAISARVVDGTVRGVLPYVEVTDVRGPRVVCGPFSDYCDPLVDTEADWREVIEPVLSLGLPVTMRCLRNRLPERDTRFAVSGRAAWHAVDLTQTEQALWAHLAPSARQNVRKAERGGVTVREGRGLEDVLLFHDMHRAVRKTKYRMLAQPRAFFEELHRAFAADGRLTVLLAEDEAGPLAGIFFIEWGDKLYYKFNASVRREKCPNDLLVWRGIQMGRRRGLARLDFGVSDLEQDGLLRFKRKFATEEDEVRRLHWAPQGYADPRAVSAGHLLSSVTRLLTDPAVPDRITQEAGEVLYGLFC